MSDRTRKVFTGATPESPLGLECRKCGCRDLRVDHTTRANGHIIRYRHCRHCGQRITTAERAIG
jgi:ribosomal protein L40E